MIFKNIEIDYYGRENNMRYIGCAIIIVNNSIIFY